MGWNGTFDDSGASEGGMPPPGAYVIEISDAQTCESKKGDGMLKLKMKMLDRDWHVYDNLMLTGKGAGMGKKKAEAFGITLVKGEKVDEARFIGLRARVHLALGSYNGKSKLEVDIGAGTHLGYDVLAPDGQAPGGEDDNFENIPFMWLLLLLPMLS